MKLMKRAFQTSYLCSVYGTNVIPYFISQNKLTWTEDRNKIAIIWMASFSYADLHSRLLLGNVTQLGDFEEPNFYYLL